MTDKKKKKTGEGRKVKTPKGKDKSKTKKSKSEYEDEITQLNRKLAQTLVTVGPIEEELIQWEDKYEEREKELDDVLGYLKAEEENQEKEIEYYDKKIEVLDKAVQEQRKHYQDIITSMEEAAHKIFKGLEDEIYNAKVTITILSSHQEQMLAYRSAEKTLTLEEEDQQRITNEKTYAMEKENLRELDRSRKTFEGIMEKIAEITENEIETTFKIRGAVFTDSMLVCQMSALGKKYEGSLRRLEQLKEEETEAKLGLEIVQEQIAMKERRLQLHRTVLGFDVEADVENSADTALYVDQEQQTDIMAELREEMAGNWVVDEIWEIIETVRNLAKEALDTDNVEEQSSVIYTESESEAEIDPLDEQYVRREAILGSIADFVGKKLEVLYGQESEYRKLIKHVACDGYNKEKLFIERNELIRTDLWRNWRLPNLIKTRDMLKRELPKQLTEWVEPILD